MVHHKAVSVATGILRGNNPGTFLKGLRSDNRVSKRANRCPAKGQPLQESFGVFFCLLTVLHTIDRAFMGCVEENRRASLPIPGLFIRGAIPKLMDGGVLKDTPRVKRKAARYPTAQVICPLRTLSWGRGWVCCDLKEKHGIV